MGKLVDGRWRQVARSTAGGAFVRAQSGFRHAIGDAAFPAEAGRYHLYVSLACPWASRAVIVRALKRLEGAIGMTVVSPDMLDHGWIFEGGRDDLTGARYLHELYSASDPVYTGAVTVPVLWDRRTSRIVNNESSEIIRMLYRSFDRWGDPDVDLYPERLRPEIDALNERIYPTVNNGVYQAGFATTQDAYEAAVLPLFDELERLDTILGGRRFLTGPDLTEADIRLFTTAIRFDLVYFAHFKCNLKQLRDLPHLHAWLRDVYHWPGVAATVDPAQIKRHYYRSQTWVNPTGIVPAGPAFDLPPSPERATQFRLPAERGRATS